MDWQRFSTRILFPWGCFFWSASLMAIVARWRLLYRDPVLDMGAVTLIQVSALDLVVHGLVGFAIAWVGNRWLRDIAYSLLFAVTIIGILFLTRMGYPLTPELFNQIGGLMEMQTSIAGAASSRTWLMLVGVLSAFVVSLSIATRYLQTLRGVLWCPAFAATVLGVGLTATLPKELRVPASHFIHTAVLGSVDPLDLLANDVFAGIRPEPLERVTVAASRARRNVIVVVLETFDTSIVTDERYFAETMPTLHGLRGSALEYTRHYTPWPFSSKALWSLACGDVPLLNGAISMRLIPTRDCSAWSRALADAGYATWVGYSGNLRYDRMGEFFAAQGFKTAWDRTNGDAGRYEGFSWGVDDLALFTAFEAWVDDRGDDPFAALLIPINTHHPFWTPGSGFDRFDDPYRNAFLYQDHLLGRLIAFLKERDRWRDTVLVITGDHGMRESRGASGVMEEARYLTPLFAVVPDRTAETISFPTSHVDLAGAILGWSGVGGRSLARHDLDSAKPVLVFDTTAIPRYMLVEKTGAFLFAPELSAIYRGERWVERLHRSCERDAGDCRRIAQSFANYIRHSVEYFDAQGIR